MLHRLMALPEHALDVNQFGFLRERVPEFHPAQRYDFLRAELHGKRFVVLDTVGIDGAFDHVPHASSVTASTRVGVECFLVRYVARWLQGEILRVRVGAPYGTFFSQRSPRSRGLPRGGRSIPISLASAPQPVSFRTC